MLECDDLQVLLTGTFDVANYGDLLFPLIASARALEQGIDIQAVSPTSGTVLPYSDAARTVEVSAMLSGSGLHADAIMVGGGYIVIGQASTGLQAYETAGVSSHAYPSLWMGATLAAAMRDIPIAWNAPGVPFPFAGSRRTQLIEPALRAADYLSVRDEASAKLIEAPGIHFNVVPDTALDLPRVWSKQTLEATHRTLVARKGFTARTRFFAVHCRGRALGDADALAAAIESFRTQHNLIPLLISLAPCMGDDAVVRALSQRIRQPHLLLDDAPTLKELAAAIACSEVYIGGSLHGYITAAAYGTPGVLMAKPAHGKFSGLLKHLERPDDLAREWKQAFDRANQHVHAGRRTTLPASVGMALDHHWATMLSRICQPDTRRAERDSFLRDYFRHGAAHLGASWVIGPQLSGQRSI